ncbi:MAG: putative Ig domain-containing protein [Verrucomicrobia bacterium]|nr:putative Ig domain-containing protein [Verrucomicrobiota bacterium]
MLNASVFRPVWRSLALAVLTAFVCSLPARASAVDDGFNPNVNGPIFATATQPDGQILIAGAFTTITPNNGAPVTRNNIARLKPDGSVDATFDPNINFQVSAMVLQPNGQILIGGKFTVIQPNGGANGFLRNRIARLNADGTLDQSFDPNCGDPATGGSLTPQVNTILLQPDGKILIGGGFTSLQPNGATSATPVNRLARLKADGTLDSSFNPNVTINNMVWALAMQPDGKILVGGGFTALTLPNEANAPQRDRLTRLNRDGTLDLTYLHTNPDNLVTAIALQRDGRILVGGNFGKFIVDPGADPVVRNHLAGLTSTGAIDTTFVPDANGNITSLVVQPDGKLLVGGYFSVLRSNDFTTVPTRGFIGRYNTDGSLDLDFTPSANYAVLSISLQADNRIVVGGNFNTFQSSATSIPVTRNRLARLNTDGTLDKTFEPDSAGRPFTAAVQSDGKLIVAGNFSSVGGVTRLGLARVSSDGTVDPSFSPVVNGPIRAVAVQGDKILIAGSFTTVTSSGSFTPLVRSYLARLNADGTVDEGFNPAPNGQIYSLAIQSSGSIILGGVFTAISRHNNVDPNLTDTDNDLRFRTNLARINADGTLDDNFDPAPDGAVSAIKIQSDGKIVIGGAFLSLRPNGSLITATSVHTARLNPDGTLATHFDPAPNGNVTSIAIQGDGKIIFAGSFTTISKHNNIDPNSKDTDDDRVTRNRIARVNADGTLDLTYDPNANNTIGAVTLQGDGKLLIGGIFTTLQPNGTATALTRQYLARLNTDGTLDNAFDAGLDQTTDNQITSILPVSGDSQIYIIGGFTSVHATPRPHLARLNSSGGLDTAFDLAVSGNTNVSFTALAVQADGKVVAGGSFSSFGGSTSRNLARFLPDSAPDATFSADVDGAVNAILVPPLGATLATQSNGLASLTSTGHLNTSYSSTAPTYNFSALLASRISGQVRAIVVQTMPSGEKKILVAGGFTTNNSAVGGNLVRFNQDGTLDTSFNPAPDNSVSAIALDDQGRILVGGSFLNIGGAAHSYFARLSADGVLDGNFTYTVDAQVSCIIVQPDDHKILISGYFQYLTLTSGGAVTTRPYVARLNTDGTIDSFDPKANAQVVAMVLQPDKKVLLGGYFTTMQSNGAGTAVTRNSISRANADGSLDTTFDPNLDNSVSALALQIDPNTGQIKSPLQILVGGSFTTVKPNGASTAVPRNGILRLNADGTLDPDFHPNANGSVLAIRVQRDGNVVIGGTFTALRPDDSLRSITRNHLARLLYANGAVDATFDPNANGNVSTLTLADDGTVLVGGSLTTLQPSGAILIGGSFANVNGIATPNLALINSDGTTNAAFVPNPDGAVQALMLETDGRMLVGGAFANVGGIAHSGLVRINTDNTIDAAYTPNVTGTVLALAQQADGRVLIGGSFSAVNGTAQPRLARLNSDGTTDATFAPAVAGAVSAILVQPDGNILVTYAGGGGGQLTRLKPDGTVDSTFTSGATGSVTAIALRTDGVIYVGGGQGATGFLQRLTATGAADASFNPVVNGAVNALTLQSDGKLLAAGAFVTVDSLPRLGLARFSTDAAAFDSVTVSADRTVVTFNHSGSAPQLIGTSIDYSADNRVWNPLGPVTRVGTTGSWQAPGLSQPLQTYYYIRVRGIIPGTQYSSSSLYEVTREFYDNPTPQFTSPTAVGAVSGAGFLYAPAASGWPTSYAAAGLPAGLVIDPATGLITGTPTVPGTYSVTVTATNSAGSNSFVLVIAVAAPSAPVPDVRLINVSSNNAAGNAHPTISGFVISGTESRSVLLRAIGPGMTGLVSTTPLAMPKVDIYNGNSLFLSLAGWGGSPTLSAVSDRLGASPPLTSVHPADTAVALTLPPGTYTMIVSDASGTGQTGTVLSEIYDASMQPGQGASRIVNLSSRGYLSSAASNVLIGGFVLQATAPATPSGTTVYRRVLLRGVGPQLVPAGVTDAIADPQIYLYDSGGHLLAQNNDWETPVANVTYPPASGSDLAAAAATVGAFALNSGGKDAALLVSLPVVIGPNQTSGTAVYTAQVSNVAGADGSALVEIYEVPANN